LAGLILHLVSTLQASAQAGIDRNVIPPAIDRSQLDLYLQWLQIDPAEVGSIDKAFGEYADRYNLVRDAGLRPLREIVRQIDRSPLPPPSAITNLIEKRDRIVSELLSIDAELLAALQTAAADVDTSIVLADRKRRFYALHLATDSPEISIDLLQVLREIEVVQFDTAVRESLIAYQYQFAEATKRRHDAAISFARKVANELLAAGFTDEAAQDPTLAPRTIESLIQALNINRNGFRFVEASNELAKLNRRTKDALVTLLPPGARERFADTYDRTAYPEIFSVRDDVSASLDRAKAMDTIDSPTRQAIANLATAYHAQKRDIEKEMVSEVIARRESEVLFDTGDESPEYYQRRELQLSALRDRLAKLQAVTTDSLASILSPEQQAQLGAH
jgi:hypothetical protein